MAKKQLEVPGTERPRNQEIEDAAEAYVEKRDARAAASKEETAARTFLEEVMRKNNLAVYVDPEETYRVELATKEKASVKSLEEEAEEEEDPADVDIPISLDEAKANRRKAQRGTQDRGAPVEP